MVANKTKSVRTETAPKILLLDEETSPIVGYSWTIWETNIIKIIHHRQIMSFAWKWLGEKQVQCLALPDFPGYKKDKRNNKSLILALHKLISKADIVVGHNLKKFDDRRANTDFLKHGLPPPPPHKIVDTLEFARHKFDFESNKLDDLCQRLGVGKKTKHWGFELWERCLAGDMEAWALMKKYNKNDVSPLLEGVYLKMRPWMAGHPNVCAIDRLDGCPICRSKNMQSRGSGMNRWGTYHRFQCMTCMKWAKGEKIKDQWRFS